MKPHNKLCLSLLATLSLVAGSAVAAHDKEAPAPGLPADNDRYVPVPGDYYADAVFPACGTMVILRSGDMRDVNQKVRVKPDATTVVDYRGGATVDVIAEPGGHLSHRGFVDELDVSGPGSERVSVDGSTIVAAFSGPSVIYPSSETDTAALAREGLPELLYYEGGELKIGINLTKEEAGAASDSMQILENTVTGVVDLCQALQKSAGRAGARGGKSPLP